MRELTFIIILMFLFVQNAIAQEIVLRLENDQGIIVDNQGSVIRWENQVENYGDAIQGNSSLGGEQMEETYPGKVNVGFVNDGSFLKIEGSSAYFSDSSFSVFYAGSAGDVKSIASLFGNMQPQDSNFNTHSGLRFVRKSNGNLALQYASPSWTEVTLNSIDDDGFFFFGFTMNASGDYKYFDNTMDQISTGNISSSIVHSSLDANLNLHLVYNGGITLDHTEVADMIILDNYMSDTDFLEQISWFSEEYPELVESDFNMANVTPEDRTNISVSEPISITLSQNVKAPVSAYPKVYVNKSNAQVSGNWSLLSSNTITFKPNQDWPYGALVKVVMDPLLESKQGNFIDLTSRADWNFIVETEENYGSVKVDIATVITRENGTHNIPGVMVLPVEDTGGKIPVHFWIHGGGWSGGTAAASSAHQGPHAEYLAEHLGIATFGVGYRTIGSDGNFTKAMDDIDAAYEWALANANSYNLDMTKISFSGGSAGSPLAALAAQRYSATKALVGFNGIYNFQEDSDSSFATGNGYGQERPSAAANSAFYQLSSPPPATILLHGTADTTIGISQSILFAEKVASEGGVSKMVSYLDEPHAFFNLDREEYEDVLYEMAEFLKTYQLADNNTSSIVPPSGFVQLRNEALNGWLERTTLPDPTDAAKKEVRLNANMTETPTLWEFVESAEAGWYYIISEAGDYLQLTNIADFQGGTNGLALRSSVVNGTGGTWVKWKLLASPTAGLYHIENKQFGNYLRATSIVQEANTLKYYTHGADNSITGSWTRWSILEESLTVPNSYTYIDNSANLSLTRLAQTNSVDETGNQIDLNTGPDYGLDWSQWKLVPVNGTPYYYIEGKGNPLRLQIINIEETKEGVSGYATRLVPNTYLGDLTQWEVIDLGDKQSFNLKSKSNEYYLSATNLLLNNQFNKGEVFAVPSNTNSKTRWSFRVLDSSALKVSILDFIDEDSSEQSLTLFPNPVYQDNSLNILLNTEVEEEMQINLFNISGQLMMSASINLSIGQNQYELNVKSLEKGLYIFKMKSKSLELEKKFLIK